MKKSAFTLIEILVVIIIIGIIASITFVPLNGMRSKSRDAKRISDIRQLQSALEMYRNDNNIYPANGTVVAGASLVGPNGQTYMKQVPSAPGQADGSCADDTYSYDGTNNTSTYSVSYCLGGSVQSAGPSSCTAVPGQICLAGGGGGGAGSEGPRSPATMANDTAVGIVAWANFNNVSISDNSYASTSLFWDGLEDSNYLKATNFNFSIPTNATINGIVVEIEKGEISGGVSDSEVKIVKSGVIGSQNKASGVWNSADYYASYGSANDLWGLAWTATDINSSSFGAAIRAMTSSSGEAKIDHIRITVYYTN